MNQLLLLEDRVSILTERCGLVLVKRDFPFRDIKVDLGFKHRLVGDYNDESFYSIPVLGFSNKDYKNPEIAEEQILQHCSAHASARNQRGVVGPQRFLVRYAETPELKLIEVSPYIHEGQMMGRHSESKSYWHGNSEQFSQKIPSFAEELVKVEQGFQTLTRH